MGEGTRELMPVSQKDFNEVVEALNKMKDELVSIKAEVYRLSNKIGSPSTYYSQERGV